MDVLPRPPEREDKTGPQFWIDEAIWGHRLHDEQTPWLTLLEVSRGISGRAHARTRPA